MANATRNAVRDRQPIQGTGLRHNHRLAKGLVFATTGGAGFVDFVSGKFPNSKSGGTTFAKGGRCASPAASSGQITWAAGTTGLDNLTGVGTLLICMRGNNNAANWRCFGSREDASTGDGVYLLYDDFNNASNGFNVGANNNNYRVNSNSGALGTNSEQSFHTFGFSWDGTNVTTWADGKVDRQSVAAAFSANVNSSRVTRIQSGSGASDFLFAYAWNRVLSAAEIADITANPWQIFYAANQPIYADAGAGGGTITGTLAQTLADGTLAAAATVAITGTSAQTLAASTLAATATVSISGVLAQTLADATLAASGTVSSGITGTLAQTLADSTLAATATNTTHSALAQTLADATLAGAATNLTHSTLAQTLADSTLSASGTVSVAGGIVGTLAQTLANSTLAATGTNTTHATGAPSLAAATLAATGTNTSHATAAATLGAATLASTGSVSISAILASTLGDSILVASGTVYTSGGFTPDPSRTYAASFENRVYVAAAENRVFVAPAQNTTFTGA